MKSTKIRAHVGHHTGGVVIISCTSFLLFTVASGTLAIASSPENLLANPGFENVNGDIPLNWTLITRTGTVVLDAAEGHDSPGSIRIDVPGNADAESGYPVSDLIVAEPDTRYFFSAWGKSSGVYGKYAPAVRVVELDSDGTWITQHNLVFSRDSHWEHKQTSFSTSTTVSKLYVYANLWNSYGTFWVDDIYLVSESTARPPVSISNLRNATGQTWINWTWTNPNDARFNHTLVYLNGTWQANTSGSFYNATALHPDEYYKIGTCTAGVLGNVNETWVNQTANTTATIPVVEFTLHTSDGLAFNITERGAVRGIALDDAELPLLSLPGGFSFIELFPSGSTNLLANPGFENVTDGIPLNWTLLSRSGTVVYDAAEGHDSSGSIRIDVPGTADAKSGYPQSDLIDAEPDTLYTFSAWGKSSGVYGKYAPAVRVVELDSDGRGITQHNLVFSRDSDWVQRNTSFTTSNDARKLYVYANIWKSYGTFWVDDVQLEAYAAEALRGVVEKNDDNSVTQYVTASDIAFKFDYIPKERYIEVHGDIQDLTGKDRAVQVRYELPVNAAGWRWSDYVRKSREIVLGTQYENVYKIGDARTQNTYPFASVCNDEQGLSLAVPMNVPRIYRMAYSTGTGYSIEYDFGLANCTDKIGPGHANFTFLMYRVDEPEWEFRAVAKKYYALYPEFFVKRNEQEGLWVRHDTSDIPHASDFGFAFDDSHYHYPSRRVYDHQQGIYPMQYTEPWGWWRSFGGNSSEPGYKEKIAAAQEDYERGTGTWRGVVTTSVAAEAMLNTAPYDENGNMYLNDDPYFWHYWGSWMQNYPENPDPDIPSPNRYDMSYAKYLRSNKGGSYADDWLFGSDCSLENTTAHSGSYSGNIEIFGSADERSGRITYDRDIPAAPLTTYNFSAWGKTENSGGTYKPCVRAAEYDNNRTWITQKNLCFGFGTTNWTQKTAAFTTTEDTAYIRVYANIWYGYGAFWFDDVELYERGSGNNLVENHGFESVYDLDDYPCSGYYVDSVHSDWAWPELENYRREHWQYADYPLVFSYDTKEPVLLGALSQYDYLLSIRKNMKDVNEVIGANIFRSAYSFYGHLIDIMGCEVRDAMVPDKKISLQRVMSYQKTNSNLLLWERQGSNRITHEEMETYMNNQMFYGIYPAILTASVETTGPDGECRYTFYWKDAALYERDRGLFKRYIPIIKAISAAGWEPIPYASCDNPAIKFERYGSIDKGIYYTVGNRGSDGESGALAIDLAKLGFAGTIVEVKELVTDLAYSQNVEDGTVHIAIPELHPQDTVVYKISP